MELFCMLIVLVVIQICTPVKIHRPIPQETILLYGNLKGEGNLKFKKCLDCILLKYFWVWAMLLWLFQNSDLQPFV